MGNAVIVTNPTYQWTGTDSGTKWVSIRDTSGDSDSGADSQHIKTYTYTTTITIATGSGVTSISGMLAADNELSNGSTTSAPSGISVNGKNTGITVLDGEDPFGTWHPFTLTGLHVGANTIVFTVRDWGGFTGLAVEWGKTQVAPSDPAQLPRFTYTGQMNDPETGLMYYGARFYDPKTGRFINQDPAAQGENLYTYVNNDPMDQTDPTGMYASVLGLSAGDFGSSSTNLNLNVGGGSGSSAGSEDMAQRILDPFGIMPASSGIPDLSQGPLPSLAEVLRPSSNPEYAGFATSLDAWLNPDGYGALGQVSNTDPYHIALGARIVGVAALTIATGGAAGAYLGAAGASSFFVGVGSGAAAGFVGGFTGDAAGQLANEHGFSIQQSLGAGAIGALSGAVGGAFAPVGQAGALALGLRSGIGEGIAVGAVGGGIQGYYDTGTAGGALYGAAFGGAIGGAAGYVSGRICFVAGTQVVVGIESEDSDPRFSESSINIKVAYRTKSIEDIQVGDQVLAKDETDEESKLQVCAVDRIYRRIADHLRILTIKSSDGEEQVLRTTDDHPFYVAFKGWINAGALELGDRLMQPDGDWSKVTTAIREEHPEGVPVFNFRVAERHTYFVRQQLSAAEPVWVHNAEYSLENRGNGGRGGGTSHASVQDYIYRNAGGGQETPILNSGGRIADNIDSLGRIHQVGDMRFRGGFSPSGRERGAIEDIRKAVGNSVDIIFHDKLGIGPSLINPDLQPTWRRAPVTYRKNL